MQCGGDVLETPDGRRIRFFATATPQGIQVRIEGRTWTLPSVASIRERESESIDPHKLEAPLTGTILAILVEEGQEVTEGEEILLLSAMKMEHKLRAHEGGRVKTIHTKVGETVDAGALLVEMEE
jgi:3-methylcrotonyl-CoA carboxylase alpha subunit